MRNYSIFRKHHVCFGEIAKENTYYFVCVVTFGNNNVKTDRISGNYFFFKKTDCNVIFIVKTL